MPVIGHTRGCILGDIDSECPCEQGDGMPVIERDERCECEGAWGLFVWRGDPEWWSCVGCDKRVRPVTPAEKAKRDAR